jgi:ribosome-associated protein
MSKKRMIDTSVPEGTEDVGPSRTALRQGRKLLQDKLDELTQTLVAMSPKALASLALAPRLEEAVTLLASMAKGGAYARQRRAVASLIRSHDLALLEQRIAAALGISRQDDARLQRLERWRTRLVDHGDAAIGELLREYPGADRTRLRQATRAAAEERAAGKSTRRSKELFQLLKELEVAPQSEVATASPATSDDD